MYREPEMNELINSNVTQKSPREAPPGPKGSLILGVMREFNRDALAFITRCRDYGDVVRARFFYVPAYSLQPR